MFITLSVFKLHEKYQKFLEKKISNNDENETKIQNWILNFFGLDFPLGSPNPTSDFVSDDDDSNYVL